MPFGHGPAYKRVCEVLSATPRGRPAGGGVRVGGVVGASRCTCPSDRRHRPIGGAGAHGRRRLARRIADGSAEIVLGDVTALPWPDSRFSAVVWLWGVEVMVGDPQQALTEIRRVLRPEGRAVLSVGALFDDDKPRGQASDLPGFWQWTEARARDELTRAGFADPEIRPAQGRRAAIQPPLSQGGRVRHHPGGHRPPSRRGSGIAVSQGPPQCGRGRTNDYPEHPRRIARLDHERAVLPATGQSVEHPCRASG